MSESIPCITATIVLPSGYKTAKEFADDCGFELASQAGTVSREALERYETIVRQFFADGVNRTRAENALNNILSLSIPANGRALAELPEYLDCLESDLIGLDVDFKLKDIIPPGVWADRVRAALSAKEEVSDDKLYKIRDLIASHISCEGDCAKYPAGCGCALTAARAVCLLTADNQTFPSSDGPAPSEANRVTPQLYRVFIGQGEYVRADEATKSIMDLQRNLRHWREECGKLHAKLAAPPSPDREAVVEECAKLLDDIAQDWHRIRDPGMANNAKSYARKIRALISAPSSNAGEGGK